MNILSLQISFLPIESFSYGAATNCSLTKYSGEYKRNIRIQLSHSIFSCSKTTVNIFIENLIKYFDIFGMRTISTLIGFQDEKGYWRCM